MFIMRAHVSFSIDFLPSFVNYFYQGGKVCTFAVKAREKRSPYKQKFSNILMSKKLYVGGLSYDTTEDALKDAFAKEGTVESAAIITDKMSGRSRGFGFVEMSSDEEAQAAIKALDGKELDGRTLTVNEARPMSEGPRR